MSKEATRRYRARLRGEDVPMQRPGPAKGYTQGEEHIQKRTRWGADHHAWKGDTIIRKSGNSRAGRMFKPEPCEVCGASRVDRHHKDRNPLNNKSTNIEFLCRRCHMREDGRLDGFMAARGRKVVLQ